MTLLSFQWPVRVYIEDTDAGGIVYYANYLRFMERARTECIRDLGFPRIETIEERTQFVVHRVALTYHRPARLDDALAVTANIVRLGRTFMVFEQKVTHAVKEDLLVEGEAVVACIDKFDFRAKRIPKNLVTAIRSRQP